MSDDLVRQLRASLPGIAQAECGGDNLAILLASFFEPSIESDELDDSGTWKQGAIDACDRVLDAIHAHYATALTEARAKIEALQGELADAKDDFLRRHNDAVNRFERIGQLESELSTLRARVREVVGPFAKAGELFGPRLSDEYDQCIYSPAAGDEYSLCGDHLRAARQLNEDLK